MKKSLFIFTLFIAAVVGQELIKNFAPQDYGIDINLGFVLGTILSIIYYTVTYIFFEN